MFVKRVPRAVPERFFTCRIVEKHHTVLYLQFHFKLSPLS